MNILACIQLICQLTVTYILLLFATGEMGEYQTAHYRDKQAAFPKWDDRTSHGVYCNFRAAVHPQAV